MKKVTVDRFEGDFAVCEDENFSRVLIEKQKLPQGVTAGCVLSVFDDGKISINAEEAEIRRRRIAEKQRKVFGE